VLHFMAVPTNFCFIYKINKNFLNPFVRPQMVFYPTDGEGSIEEIWDGEKLAEGECLDQLTPMVAAPRDPKYHYYVNELCELAIGERFIPMMFLRRPGSTWARGYMVSCVVTVSNLYIYGLNSKGWNESLKGCED
jgi:hypothetical protein